MATVELKNKIKAQAQKIREKSLDLRCSNFFIEGAFWFRDNIWHSYEEEPVIGEYIIIIDGICEPCIHFTEEEDDPFDTSDRWCYLSDILPNIN